MDKIWTVKRRSWSQHSTKRENSPENLTRRGQELHADEVGNMNTEQGRPNMFGHFLIMFSLDKKNIEIMAWQRCNKATSATSFTIVDSPSEALSQSDG